jgi:PKD repeat protein
MRQSPKIQTFLAILLLASLWFTSSAVAQSFLPQTAQALSVFATAAPITTSFKDGSLPDAGYVGTVDAYLMETLPGNNFGTETALLADGRERNHQTKSFGEIASVIAWDVSSIPSDALITSAQVTFEISDASSGTHFLHPMTNPWLETTVSWNDIAAPGAMGSAVLGSFIPDVAGSKVGVALIQAWVNGSTPNNGMVIKSGGARNGIEFGSSEGSVGVRPQLTINYEDSNPAASFLFSCSGLTCNFDASTSTGGAGTITSYSWSFGDLTNGSTVKPSHIYAAEGTYSVELTVTNDLGKSDVTTQNVVLATVPPTAAFTFSCTILTCNFDASTSTGGDGTIISYSWNFGDATSGATVNPSHIYAAEGTYSVELTVTNDLGKSDITTQN